LPEGEERRCSDGKGRLERAEGKNLHVTTVCASLTLAASSQENLDAFAKKT
jgi:hypothetical protein